MWSSEVHTIKEFADPNVIDEHGNSFSVWETLPVDKNSKTIVIPAHTQGFGREEEQQDMLHEYATALEGFIGDEGIPLQVAGSKLRALPGFSATMAEAEITGIGALQRFIRLFPERFRI